VKKILVALFKNKLVFFKNIFFCEKSFYSKIFEDNEILALCKLANKQFVIFTKQYKARIFQLNWLKQRFSIRFATCSPTQSKLIFIDLQQKYLFSCLNVCINTSTKS